VLSLGLEDKLLNRLQAPPPTPLSRSKHRFSESVYAIGVKMHRRSGTRHYYVKLVPIDRAECSGGRGACICSGPLDCDEQLVIVRLDHGLFAVAPTHDHFLSLWGYRQRRRSRLWTGGWRRNSPGRLVRFLAIRHLWWIKRSNEVRRFCSARAGR
jgi:hypothetical protein